MPAAGSRPGSPGATASGRSSCTSSATSWVWLTSDPPTSSCGRPRCRTPPRPPTCTRPTGVPAISRVWPSSGGRPGACRLVTHPYHDEIMGRDVFYITTPIYYPNDVPHIGHGYTSVAADFIARYHRLIGERVLHLTGTDEHGLNLQRKAEAAGVSPHAWVDEMEPQWREVWARLDIGFD